MRSLIKENNWIRYTKVYNLTNFLRWLLFEWPLTCIFFFILFYLHLFIQSASHSADTWMLGAFRLAAGEGRCGCHAMAPVRRYRCRAQASFSGTLISPHGDGGQHGYIWILPEQLANWLQTKKFTEATGEGSSAECWAISGKEPPCWSLRD